MAKHKDQHWMLPITRLHIATCVLLFLGAFTRGKLSLERGCLSFDWLKKKKIIYENEFCSSSYRCLYPCTIDIHEKTNSSDVSLDLINSLHFVITFNRLIFFSVIDTSTEKRLL